MTDKTPSPSMSSRTPEKSNRPGTHTTRHHPRAPGVAFGDTARAALCDSGLLQQFDRRTGRGSWAAFDHLLDPDLRSESEVPLIDLQDRQSWRGRHLFDAGKGAQRTTLTSLAGGRFRHHHPRCGASLRGWNHHTGHLGPLRLGGALRTFSRGFPFRDASLRRGASAPLRNPAIRDRKSRSSLRADHAGLVHVDRHSGWSCDQQRAHDSRSGESHPRMRSCSDMR